MPLNIPGLLVPFQLLLRPRLVLPAISKDIRRLDFQALRDAGYRGAVFDKDNCLTIPHEDRLVPELQEAWKECRSTFGHDNVLIVSNSAGTRQDAGAIQAESVSYHLSAPVLRHNNLKPGYPCISSIRTYFSSLPRPVKNSELIVVGDRVFTDIVMANRMNPKYRLFPPQARADVKDAGPEGPLAIWTTGVWKKESMFMRWFEKQLVATIQKWIVKGPEAEREGWMERFVKPEPVVKIAQEKTGLHYWVTRRLNPFAKAEPAPRKRGRWRRIGVAS
ncbi:HAD phosphatase [Heliocybe sulcata]|uniref:HAD phosphatase n=1 Tax=Heliocybe sulcata TaxID=5364 RepID=A0A5C3N181_9AGAM|nr:HAD phosphatase [Heliocybe sulcata]